MTRAQSSSARIIATDHNTKAGASAITCVIGEDLQLLPAVLGKYCVRELSPRIDDLVVIAGIVAFADRAVARQVSIGWSREFHVSIPVNDQRFWEEPGTIASLTNVLDALTGDNWHFHFTRRTKPTRVTPQATLSLTGQECTVVPFSDGLDSLAAARLAKHRTPGTTLLLVTTGKQHPVTPDARAHRVAIPFTLPNRRARFPETSYRSRAFVFGSMAGIAAQLVTAQQIIVTESGQSSLGPWLLPVGNEAPDIRTHPTFTTRLAQFLSTVLDHNIRFDHPHLWETKGETLRELHEQYLDDGWQTTRSCPRRRHMALDGKNVQCGVCAACLLRRQSLHAAGLDERHDHYLWADLAAPTLAQAAPNNARPTRKNDQRYAWCGALEMANLAAYNPTRDHRFTRATAELAHTLGIAQHEACTRLTRLVEAHAREWNAFLSTLPNNSFLVRWLAGRAC